MSSFFLNGGAISKKLFSIELPSGPVHVMRGNVGELVEIIKRGRSLMNSFILTPHTHSFLISAAAMSTVADAVPTVVIDQKRALRSKLKRDLKAFPAPQRIEEDISIQSNVLDSTWFKSTSRLCSYISCEALREVDTSRILSDVLKPHDNETKKKLYVPRVEDKNSHMRMLHISSMNDSVANSMNILEPSPVDANGNQLEDVMFANDPVDIFLLPGVAFDKQGRRLGRGGGYYDLFLTNYKSLAMEKGWKQPLLIALSYSLQILEEGVIPVTANDVLVDALVSPSGVIPISPAALENM